jgi:hypothetical protein
MATTPPDILYHYCGASGFKGIIESKALWLSKSSMMNDYMEYRWMVGKACERVKQRRNSVNGKIVDKMLAGLKKSDAPYISCFSCEPDLLSQWRAYSDDGTGYAIGFSYRGVKKALPFGYYDISLEKVEYDEKRQQEWLCRIVHDDFLKSVKGTHFKSPELVSGWTSALIRSAATYFKNPGFREEKEWRIVYTRPLISLDEIPYDDRENSLLKLLFRVSGPRIVPYYTLPFPVDAITEIRLGPKNVCRDDRRCLELLLTANGYDITIIKIINSVATYR